MMLRPRVPVNRLCIRAFNGYGSSKRVCLTGMVVEEGGIVNTDDSDPALDNLRKTFRRFLSRPGPQMDVLAIFGSCRKLVRSDDNGYFFIEISSERLNLPGQGTCQIILKLVDNSKNPCGTAVGKISIPPGTAEFGVISDIDDTILYTRATDRVQMILIVLLRKASSRIPFPGASAFYRALQNGSKGGALNPFFYVTSSSWRMHDIMHDFLTQQNFPAGPVIMRVIRFTRSSLLDPKRHNHKLMVFRQIIETYPKLPFLLIGDSGQKDPEIYAEIVHRFPGRIPVVYIRDVLPSASRRKTVSEIAESVSSDGSKLLLVKNTMEAAIHAASMGWIDSRHLSAIEHQMIREKTVYPNL